MATAPAPANLPLFYKDLVPLPSVDHADFRARPRARAEFRGGQHALPRPSEEFVLACPLFPYVSLAVQSSVPLALQGLIVSCNPFADDQGQLVHRCENR